ncbi:MAG: cupin, partial [Deltaproteobacteria bacterium]
VDFTDIRCPHCRKLHEDLGTLREEVGDLFSIDNRHFPLDSSCNAKLPMPPKDGVSCLAAKAQICMEGDPKAWDFSSALFEAQRDLSEQKIYEIASRFTDVDRLKACMRSEQTEATLQDDIALAWNLGIEGTPLVFVNDRRAPSFSGLLYLLILNEGRSTHPAFKALPPPSLSAHMH